MGLLRLLGTVVVGFFLAWIAVALQRAAATGSALAVVAVLVGLVVLALAGFRLVV